jgi:hypothetical protein
MAGNGAVDAEYAHGVRSVTPERIFQTYVTVMNANQTPVWL